MPEKLTDISSLKKLAERLATAKNSSEANNEELPADNSDGNDEELSLPSEANEPQVLASSPPVEEENLEDYNEFPRLEKFKTYEMADVKGVSKAIPARDTVLKCTKSEIVIFLKNSEVYEAAGKMNFKALFLQKSHAVLEGLHTCEALTFTQDQLGNYVLTVNSCKGSEVIKLGCIVKFEFVRPGHANLLLSIRDIDSNISVVGAPCSIEFQTDGQTNAQEAIEASVQHLGLRKDKILTENREAGNFNWNIA